ncbi:MAG TPA: helix-turn-helix transcriptional regulator [Chloroflexota bacterium]|jgi:LuxR family maltose regulon positive regulatory protein
MTETFTAQSGIHNYVRDVLTREVLDRQPAHVREVLLESRVFDRLSADMSVAIGRVVRDPADFERLDQCLPVPGELVAEWPVESLTEREMEVLSLVAAGLANQQIAQSLVVVVDTVKKHVSHVMRKLNADNRTQAVVRARALGLLA